MRALAVLTLFLIGVYFISSFAKTYTAVTYQEERRLWQEDIEQELSDQRKDLMYQINSKYSVIQKDLTRYQLRQDERVESLEDRVSELENQLKVR
tara:strand:+ start:9402 stop:9686 length:285 start_codon:yes stop_codon:yes gene_type:complete